MPFSRNWEYLPLKLRRYEPKVQFKVRVMLSAPRSREVHANAAA